MITLLHVTFPDATFPVGTASPGYWANYEALKQAGKTEVRVTPELSIRLLDDPSHPTLYSDLQLFFTPEEWDVERWGNIYTDEAFEEAVQAWAQTLQLPPALSSPSYTEAGMQGEDHVSMECSTLDARAFVDYWDSAHAALAWLEQAEARGFVISVRQMAAA